MIPFTIEIIGKDEPIDAVKIAFGVNRKDGRRYVYAVTIDGRIVSFDSEMPAFILWENTPSKEDFEMIDRLIGESEVGSNMTFDTLIEQYGETIQIWGQANSTDGLGNTITVWTTNKGTFTGVVARPSPEDIALAAGRISITDKKLYAPSDASIVTGDRLEIDGVKYDCYGSSADWGIKQGSTVQYLKLFLKRVIE